MIINWNKDTRPNASEEEILTYLKSNYQNVNGIFPISNGVLNQCFGIKTSEKNLFGKILNSSKLPKHISAEIEFGKILNESGIPSPKIVPNKEREYITSSPNGKLIVYNFISGNQFDFSYNEISNAAQMQAKIHRLNLSSLEKFLEQSDITNEIPLLVSNLEKHIQNGIDPEGLLIKVVTKLKKQNDFDVPGKSKPIHADYHPWNLLFSDSGEVNGVLDFDYLQMGKNLYDLGSTITYFIRNPPKNNFDKNRSDQVLEAYLSSYNQIEKLSNDKRDFVPAMMVLRSADNLSRDLNGKDSSHILTDSNKRNLSILNWAMGLMR